MKTIAVVAALLGGLSVSPAFNAAPTMIRSESTPSALTAKTTTYVVQPGDTLSEVAAAFHTTVAALAAQNGIVNPNVIDSGERLTIPAPTPNLPPGSQALVCTLTAYTDGYASTGKYPGNPGYGITSTGQRARQGLSIAVDPNVIPYGTPVFIPGVGLRIADDTGGAIIGSHIDVFYNRQQTAVDFGVKQNVIVYLIPRTAVAFRRQLPVFAAMGKERSGSRFGQRVYGPASGGRQVGSAGNRVTPPSATSTATPATSTATPATSTATSTTLTATPATSTATPATSTATPATSTATPATSTDAPATSTATPATATAPPATSTA
ncbi:MAG: 3D domain-containing protein, partial [Bacilli bacterium]